ncbi:hypothetical protein ACLGL1_05965 [Peptococcus simiae]|uniref:hypothetical protein n=1 Tax=Peptococcus simiae TaxID=1643805 RepID=UPI00397EAB0C
MTGVSESLYAILTSEGRPGLMAPQQTAGAVLLAAEVWDLLTAGVAWGVSGQRFYAAKPLPEALAHTAASYTAICQGQHRPGPLFRQMGRVEVQALRQKAYADLPLPFADEADDFGDMPPSAVAYIRHITLKGTPNPADDALLLALARASWLKGFYIRGKMDQVVLSKRLKAIRLNPPLAGGWSFPDLLRPFLVLSEWARL